MGASSRWSGIARFSIFLLFVVSAFSLISGAQQSFPPISPDELKMTSEPKAPGAPAIILFREVNRDDNTFTPHEDNYYRIKILTEEGRKWGDVEIPYFTGRSVSNVRARSIRPDGSVAEFDGKLLDKTVEKFQGFKYQVKAFTLPDVQVGSIVEYRFTYDLLEHFLYQSHWIVSADLFTKDAKFALKRGGDPRRPISLRWTWDGLPSGVNPVDGPDHVVRMEVQNIPAFQKEDYMPPENELKARVDFIYEDEFMEKDADQYWRHVGQNRDAALEHFVDKRKAMADAVSQIIAPSDTPEVKLRKIYDRVQQLRNTTFEVRKSIEELKRDKEKPAENVEDVWKSGYGNEVQLTWLYLALVRAAGFDAYGVWVSSRSEYFFNPKSMESRKLGVSIVLVKLDGKDLYFNPGGPFTPFGMLSWSETATQGLCLNKDGGTWVKTPLPESSESRIERTAKLKLADNGNLEGKITLTYTGLEAMYHRIDVRNEDDVARKKFLEERVKDQVPVGMEAELTNKPDWKNSETPLVAEFDVTIPGWASGAGKRLLIPAGVFTAGERKTFEHANRVNPIYVHYPHEKVDDVTIELPAGWQVGTLPPPQVQNGHVVTYTLKAENDQNTLHLTRKLTMDFLLLDQKYYTSLRTFFQLVRTGDDQQIVLLPAASAASN
jgi:hypothetical protein